LLNSVKEETGESFLNLSFPSASYVDFSRFVIIIPKVKKDKNTVETGSQRLFKINQYCSMPIEEGC
jgi:hypothetical protein